MQKTEWLNRQFNVGQPVGMLPFFLERRQGTMARLEQKVLEVPEHILSNTLNEKWSIKQNIGHLADLEVIGHKRLTEIENGITPMTSAMIPPQQDYNGQPIREVLDYFFKNRKATLNAYKTITENSLAKSSLHPRLKILMNPVDLALFHAEHDDHHLVRINEILETLNES